MAKMIDQRSSFHGEAKVWDKVKEYLPNDVIVYNNREINGREFDYCLFLEGMGALIIEVKGGLQIKSMFKEVIILWSKDMNSLSGHQKNRLERIGLLY